MSTYSSDHINISNEFEEERKEFLKKLYNSVYRRLNELERKTEKLKQNPPKNQASLIRRIKLLDSRLATILGDDLEELTDLGATDDEISRIISYGENLSAYFEEIDKCDLLKRIEKETPRAKERHDKKQAKKEKKKRHYEVPAYELSPVVRRGYDFSSDFPQELSRTYIRIR
jgi:hypothetical protein